MKHLVVFFSLLVFFSYSQDLSDITPEERAYLFHIVKKSPILDTNIGRYFDYRGPSIKFANGELNYDSLEICIINQPEILQIRRNEIAKSPKGVLSEAANKMAIWELNKILHAKRTKDEDWARYKYQYEGFESSLLQSLPNILIIEEEDGKHIDSKLHNIMNPTLALKDRIAQLETIKGLSPADQKQTIEALNQAINSYVSKRSEEIFKALGGKAETYINILTAAGDGSTTSGLLNEREKDEKGRWNKGLPKAVGLFPYQVYLTPLEKKKKQEVKSFNYTIHDLKTMDSSRLTVVHFDVWGYNTEKQTTVVLEKKGLSYPLFGSGETRFLSPDSTFSSGTTFMSVINDLEHNKIGDLNEKINGKKGYDYWIKHYEEEKDDVELKIIKNEKAYSDMGYNPITTSGKVPRRVKKAKKRAIKAGSGSFEGGGPKTASDKIKRGKEQTEIVNLYNRFEWLKLKIKELEKERQEAIDLRSNYQQRLDGYKRLMGYKWASFTEKDGLYIFEDSSTFDIYTQDFTFQGNSKSEDFEVRLVAIPESSLSNSADEVMLHINVTDAIPNYNARLNIALEDVFESDKWNLGQQLLGIGDSVALVQLFERLEDKESHFKIIARGCGVGEWNGSLVEKNRHPNEITSYPGRTTTERNASKSSPAFAQLRKSEVLVKLDRAVLMEINSFTDPVASSIELTKIEQEYATKYNLSKNDILSARRTASILIELKEELNILAGTFLSRERSKKVIDRFNIEYGKVKISVGSTSIKLTDLLD